MFNSLAAPLGLLDDLRIWGRGEVGLRLQPLGCAARWRKRCLRPGARNQVTGARKRRHHRCAAETRQPGPGKRSAGKTLQKPGLARLGQEAGRAKPSLLICVSLLAGAADEEDFVHALFLFCFVLNPGVSPWGLLKPALQADADKLWPFTTNLGRVAACIGHPSQFRLPDLPPSPLKRIPSVPHPSPEWEREAHAALSTPPPVPHPNWF